jgi:hypothetical protein
MKLHDELGRPHMDNPGGVASLVLLKVGKNIAIDTGQPAGPLHGKILRTPPAEGGLK